MQETRIGRARRPPDSQPNEQKNSRRRDQFAEQVHAQERLDVFGRAILNAGKFRPHLLGPDRHHEEPQRRVIEIIILLVGVGLHAVVKPEIAARKSPPGIRVLFRRKPMPFDQCLVTPIKAVCDVLLVAQMGRLFPGVAAQRHATKQKRKQDDPEKDSPGTKRRENSAREGGATPSGAHHQRDGRRRQIKIAPRRFVRREQRSRRTCRESDESRTAWSDNYARRL